MDYSVSFVRDYCQFLNGLGISNKELYNVLNVSAIKMNIPFLRIKAENVNTLFNYAIHKSGEINTGLKLACESWYVPDKVIYMMMWNSRSPLEAMRIACKYLKLITTTFAAIFSEDDAHFSIEFIESTQWSKNKSKWSTLIKTTLDVAFSTIQNTFPKMFNKEVYPIEVRMTFDKPADDELYYTLFRCPLYFNETKNIIVYDKTVLQKDKNSYYDKKTFDNIIRYADDLIRQQITRTEEFSVIVENEILSVVGKGDPFPNIQQVSKNLGMSIRSFQRKLEQEKLNYKDLLDVVRKDFALHFINKEQNLNVNELAYALGFSDSSSFIKAFKRWYGVTPGKFLA